MPEPESEIYIGLMSGTSIDAIDAVAINLEQKHTQIIASHTHPIPVAIQQSIADLCHPGDNEILRMGKLDSQLADLFSGAVCELLKKAKLETTQIIAIGSHGQTIRHFPNGEHSFTLQIGNPAKICEKTNITTVADFRRADMAAGGQGAPLVPAFHQAVFYDKNIKRVVLNIGGMANISILDEHKLRGFDTGPGNILLNEWIQLHHGEHYDKNGNWSQSNTSNQQLLEKMLNDAYFSQPPPKSTGREYFNLDWLNEQIKDFSDTAGNIQSTLCELTARSVSDAVRKYASDCQQILVCGGGVHNKDLISRLEKNCRAEVCSTLDYGVNPDYVEAAAFAWFARQTLHNIPSNAPAVTGAKHPVLMGAIYPAYHPPR